MGAPSHHVSNDTGAVVVDSKARPFPNVGNSISCSPIYSATRGVESRNSEKISAIDTATPSDMALHFSDFLLAVP